MTRDQDVELAKEAIRVLSRWPNALPGPHLLALARTTGDATRHALALNGFVEVTVHESDLARRLDLLCEALKTARRVEEKRQTLGRIGQIPTRSALEAVLPYLADAAIGNEAAAAIVNIGDKLAATDPKPVAQAAAQVLAHCKTPEIVRRAALLRSLPKGKGPFLRDWLVCGPYTQQGITGALNLFPIAFGPEKPGEKVVWKAVPAADLVNLGAILPGQVDCVAYLKTQVIAPQDCEALLLLGSDDGVKAWLNGGEVHSNNIDRGAVPDQDTAPIKLKKGVNVLLLKITQGGGGWVACARIVGLDGEPIAGLRGRPPEKRTNKKRKKPSALKLGESRLL
jgi:hypothetical protein